MDERYFPVQTELSDAFLHRCKPEVRVFGNCYPKLKKLRHERLELMLERVYLIIPSRRVSPQGTFRFEAVGVGDSGSIHAVITHHFPPVL